jgi:hypothetical protein
MLTDLRHNAMDRGITDEDTILACAMDGLLGMMNTMGMATTYKIAKDCASFLGMPTRQFGDWCLNGRK